MLMQLIFISNVHVHAPGLVGYEPRVVTTVPPWAGHWPWVWRLHGETRHAQYNPGTCTNNTALPLPSLHRLGHWQTFQNVFFDNIFAIENETSTYEHMKDFFLVVV